jgi:deferrochelatase/peroxidase EfeB
MQQSRLLSDDTTLQPIAIFLSIIVVKPDHFPQFRKCEKPLCDTTQCHLALVLKSCSHETRSCLTRAHTRHTTGALDIGSSEVGLIVSSHERL